MVVTAVNLLSEALNFNEPSDLFSFITSKIKDFKDHIDDMATIESFFSSQRKHFDLALECRIVIDANLIHINDDEIKSKISELNKILNMPSPYSSIPKLAGICQAITDHINLLISDKKVEIKDELNKAKKDFIIKWEEIGLTGISNDSIIDKFQRLENLIQNSLSIDSLIARRSDILKLVDDSKIFINDEIEKWQKSVKAPNKINKLGDEAAEVQPVTIKKIAQVDVKKINKKGYIETQEDIEAFVNELKMNLEKHINENKRVEII